MELEWQMIGFGRASPDIMILGKDVKRNGPCRVPDGSDEEKNGMNLLFCCAMRHLDFAAFFVAATL